jgi:penicillin-binding protein 1C
MSDRTDENRPSEGAGGWYVPKNAMTEQEIAASQQSSQQASGPTSNVPVPGAAPEQPGSWFTPPDAVAPTPPVPAPEAATPASPAIDLPQGSALSTEADYSNYVPGKGFVSAAEAAGTGATDAAPTSSTFETTGDQPQVEVAAVSEDAQVSASGNGAVSTDAPVERHDPSEPLAVTGPGQPVQGDVQTGSQPAQPAIQDPAAIYRPTGDTGAQVAASSSQPATPPAKPVNPELVKRYVDVEKAVQALRRKYNAGTITRNQLQDELRKLMILDEDGFWWMIGLESDRWYKYDGKDWVASARPGKSDYQDGGDSKPVDPLSRVSGGTAAKPTASLPSEESSTPLPLRVPITDPGATMVGLSAPRLDNTLKQPAVSEPTMPIQAQQGPAKFLERASRQGGVAAGGTFDGGVTMPSGSGGVTQPGAAVSAGAIPVAARGTAGTAPHIRAGEQPDYGEPPSGFLADRQRTAGCVVRLALVGMFLTLIVALIGIGVAVLGYYSIIQQYDTKITGLEAAVTTASQSARILDKNGQMLYQINDPNLGARIRVPLNQISPDMIAATIRIEDKRFYENPGFDPIAIARTVVLSFTEGYSTGGASSITQQLTRALVLDAGAAQDRTARRKITEIIVSSEISRRYTKSQILEYYLNTVYYGNLAYGVEAAAQTYFGKSAKDLNIAESTFLAGLVQAPATYDPVLNRQAAMTRFDNTLTLMQDFGCIQMEHEPQNQGPYCLSKDDIDANVVLIAQVKAKAFRAPTSNVKYPHFVNYVQQELETQFGKDALYSSGFIVYTTIDPKIQDVADKAVKDQIAALRGRNVTNGAVLAMRPADGAILAMVGSADFNNKDIDGQFNVTLAARQPGSSIKPFVYTAALERDPNNNYWTPATIIWDVPTCFGAAPGYCPRNYDDKFHGPQSMRSSLANSYNIPAVKSLQYVGIDRFKQLAERVGLTFPLTQPEQGGLPMALGGVEVPLIDMVHGYSVFANNGKRVDMYAIAKVTRKNGDNEEVVFEAKDHPAQQVVEPAIAYLMTNILSDNQARLPAFGTALNLSDGRPAAVKTGTTNDSKDNWTIGYTPQLVVGVWVGNSNNSPMVGTSGVTGAAPIWKSVMVGALAGQPIMQFTPPANVQQANICADFGTQDFPECKNRRQGVFFAPNPPPAPQDIFKTLQVDSFSGLIANESCPDYVENRIFLAISDETAIAWLNNTAEGQAWAKNYNLTLPIVPPPTTACDPNTPRPVLSLTQPQPNSQVRGLTEVRGSVYNIPGFNRYQIEIAPGLNAAGPFEIVDGPYGTQQSEPNAFLGRLDTNTRANGAYTLRLVAIDSQGRQAKLVVPIIINNLAATTVPPTPIPLPEQPTFDPNSGVLVTQQPGVAPTETPIVIQPNPPTATTDPNVAQPQIAPTNTLRPIFPPTTSP